MHVSSTEPGWSRSSIGDKEDLQKMLSRWGCVAAICLGLASQAEAAERSGVIRRASCAVVRLYVAKFSAYAAEAWARSHGATEAEIEAARRCLKDTPAQTARAGHWTLQ
jgi:hypothetical protein